MYHVRSTRDVCITRWWEGRVVGGGQRLTLTAPFTRFHSASCIKKRKRDASAVPSAGSSASREVAEGEVAERNDYDQYAQ